MKKILTAFIVLLAAVIMSASAAILPSWVENLSPGQSYTYGEYSASKGFAEGKFTPTTFTSKLQFGDGVTGADIDQKLATSIGGKQVGSVDRQLMGQSASAYAAYNDPNGYWDPEKANTWLVADMGMTKNQFAAFSGALVAADAKLEEKTGDNMNKDAYTDDPYLGSHQLKWLVAVDGDDPSWTTKFTDDGVVFAPTAQLFQEVVDASVTISANTGGAVATPDDVFQISDPKAVPLCNGEGEIWQGFRNVDTQTKLAEENTGKTLNDFVSLDMSNFKGAQLTELAASMNSDVSLKQVLTNANDGPFTTTILAGSSSLGGEFENAFLDPGVKLSVKLNTGTTPFNYWWQ
jgi:hypothetical protein